MKSWLNKGRPFSFIALDTMANCAGNRPALVEQYSPKILKTDKNEVEKRFYMMFIKKIRFHE
ncbi:hypothetical protein BsIDN1_35490 [Bacillus safensis]|uniref:Uncharacterized protein n=1 Tax=Bacillus safensis TaxID=561879 RepID=A0A5S9MAK5_BACIA|nr:hypothetical protein BsIDN1_35490 [Bacillus safensis]